MKYIMKGDPQTNALDTYHLIMAVTNECNLACRHCYNGDLNEIVTQQQWKDVISRWADFVKKEGKEGIAHFKGGEPFVFDGLNELLNYSADQGQLVFITSNGTLVGDEQAQNLGEVYERTGGKVILSLNGSKPEIDSLLRQKGNYQRTVEATKRLKENGVPFDINYVVHSGNEEDVGKAVYLAKKLGAVQFNMLHLVMRGRAKDKGVDIPKVDLILPQLEMAMNNGARSMLEWSVADMIGRLSSGEYECSGCTAGFRGFAYITPDGNVYSCPNTTMEEHRLGTIDDSFETLFENGKARNLREIHKGRLVCKGELEAYRDDNISLGKLLKEEELINKEIKREPKLKKKREISLCFNRNW